MTNDTILCDEITCAHTTECNESLTWLRALNQSKANE